MSLFIVRQERYHGFWAKEKRYFSLTLKRRTFLTAPAYQQSLALDHSHSVDANERDTKKSGLQNTKSPHGGLRAPVKYGNVYVSHRGKGVAILRVQRGRNICSPSGWRLIDRTCHSFAVASLAAVKR